MAKTTEDVGLNETLMQNENTFVVRWVNDWDQRYSVLQLAEVYISPGSALNVCHRNPLQFQHNWSLTASSCLIRLWSR